MMSGWTLEDLNKGVRASCLLIFVEASQTLQESHTFGCSLEQLSCLAVLYNFEVLEAQDPTKKIGMIRDANHLSNVEAP